MATPIVTIASDVTVAQSDVSSSKSVSVGPASAIDSVGGANISSFNWVLLYKPPGSSAQIRTSTINLATAILDSVDTWGNYVLLCYVVDGYGQSSEVRSAYAPTSAFSAVRVISTTSGLEKLGSLERKWTERYNAVVNQVEINSAPPSLDDLGISATKENLSELCGGDATKLHKHFGTAISPATQTSPGVVILAEAPSNTANPVVLTSSRGVWNASFTTGSTEAAFVTGATASDYKAVFVAEEDIELTQVVCVAEEAAYGSNWGYRLHKLSDANFKNKITTVTSDIQSTTLVAHSSATDNTKPWYGVDEISPPALVAKGSLLALYLSSVPTLASSAVFATSQYALETHHSATNGAGWVYKNGHYIDFTTPAGTTQLKYSANATATITVKNIHANSNIYDVITINYPTSPNNFTLTYTAGTDWAEGTTVTTSATDLANKLNAESHFTATSVGAVVTLTFNSDVLRGSNGNSVLMYSGGNSTHSAEINTVPGTTVSSPQSPTGGANNDVLVQTDNATTIANIKTYLDTTAYVRAESIVLSGGMGAYHAVKFTLAHSGNSGTTGNAATWSEYHPSTASQKTDGTFSGGTDATTSSGSTDHTVSVYWRKRA